MRTYAILLEFFLATLSRAGAFGNKMSLFATFHSKKTGANVGQYNAYFSRFACPASVYSSLL